MNDIYLPGDEPSQNPGKPRVERIERSGELRPGEYWRAKKKQKISGWVIDAGDVLLIGDVRQDGQEDHRVDLIPPPSCGSEAMKQRISILVHKFEETWEPAPDAEQVRAREMADIQRHGHELQEQLLEAQRNPAYLNTQVLKALAAKAPEPSAQGEEVGSNLPARLADVSVLNVLQVASPTLQESLTGNASLMIHQTLDLVRQAHQVAEAQGQWFANKAGEIATCMASLAPFYQEKAAVALARTGRAIERAKSLLEGVATLTLFTGQDVEVIPVCGGEPAPADTPIHLYQRKLWADEEMSYVREYADNTVDADSFEDFAEALASSKTLVDVMVPMARSVVLCGLSRQDRGMHDDRPIENYLRRRRNTRSLLLVRDGERIFVVLSPVESHETASRLFPEMDVEGSLFTGIDGKRVTPEDLRWTDHLDQAHREAVHYRRWAVLLAGLISRDTFWKGVDYQDLFYSNKTDSLFRLIRDDSGEGVIADARPGLRAFIAANQVRARAGSRILADLHRILQPGNAPNAYSFSRGKPYCRVKTGQRFRRVTLEHEGGALFFRLRMKKEFGEGDLPVRIAVFSEGRWVRTDGLSWLCVDRLDPDELDRLMGIRNERRHYMGHMSMLHAVRDYAREVEAQERDLRAWLCEQLAAAALVDSPVMAREAVIEALAAWRATGGPYPAMGSAGMVTLLDRLYRTTRESAVSPEAVAALCEKEGIEPLRLAVDEKAVVRLYAVPRNPDHRGAPQAETDYWRIDSNAGGLRMEPRAPAILATSNPKHSVLKQWEGAKAFEVEGTPSLRLPAKRELLEKIEAGLELGRRVLAGPLGQEQAESVFTAFEKAVRDYVKATHYMPSMVVSLPVGMVTQGKRTYVVQISDDAERCLASVIPGSAEQIQDLYRRVWCSNDWMTRLKKRMAIPRSPDHLTLQFVPVDGFDAGLFTTDCHGNPIEHDDGEGYHHSGARSLVRGDRLLGAGRSTGFRIRDYQGEGKVTHAWFAPAIDMTQTSPLMSFLTQGS